MCRAAAVLLLIAGTVARADPAPSAVVPAPEPPVVWSTAAGVGIGIFSLAVGGALCVTDDLGNKETGTMIMMGGLVLAPAVSHLIAREWSRAAIFSALPLASMIAVAGVLAYHPIALNEGFKNDPSVAYATLLGVSVLSSAVGVADSLGAGERAKKNHLTLAPVMARDHVGLALGGTW